MCEQGSDCVCAGRQPSAIRASRANACFMLLVYHLSCEFTLSEYLSPVVPPGLEPGRIAAADFESAVSANFTKGPNSSFTLTPIELVDQSQTPLVESNCFVYYPIDIISSIKTSSFSTAFLMCLMTECMV